MIIVQMKCCNVVFFVFILNACCMLRCIVRNEQKLVLKKCSKDNRIDGYMCYDGYNSSAAAANMKMVFTMVIDEANNDRGFQMTLLSFTSGRAFAYCQTAGSSNTKVRARAVQFFDFSGIQNGCVSMGQHLQWLQNVLSSVLRRLGS